LENISAQISNDWRIYGRVNCAAVGAVEVQKSFSGETK
jgi:hypothetical protein